MSEAAGLDYALHSNNGSLTLYINFINVLIIWRHRKVITKLRSGPRGDSLIATPTVITCYLSKWNFHVCSRSLLSVCCHTCKLLNNTLLLLPGLDAGIILKLFTECINNELGYEKNTNYVNWNGSVLYSIKV